MNNKNLDTYTSRRGAIRGAAALITGASSGIGLELARLFAKDGYDLVLVARNRQKLESLAKELQSEHQIQVTVMVQDLADPSAPQAITDQLVRQSNEIEVLVNNAGTQVYGKFAEAELEQLLALIQINTTALVNLTHLLLPFAAFLVCMTLSMPNADKYRQGVAEWLAPVRALVRPVSEGLFAGALDISQVPSFGDRLKFRLSVALGAWSEGDHRDWNAIRTWAADLKPRLMA